MQRGKLAGQVAGDSHTSEHRIPAASSSTHSALAQSRSLVQGVPASPVPRGPSTQDTIVPVRSWLVQAWVGGQS
jgi:hypothetical protein